LGATCRIFLLGAALIAAPVALGSGSGAAGVSLLRSAFRRHTASRRNSGGYGLRYFGFLGMGEQPFCRAG
jgi:hypothetical protein